MFVDLARSYFQRRKFENILYFFVFYYEIENEEFCCKFINEFP